MISFIVLSYNYQNFIIETLESIAKVNIDKEVIVIDDGSTDNSVEVIQNFINNNGFDDFRVVEKANSGLVHSLNLGLQQAKHEFIYFIASDDIVCPQEFEAMFYKLSNSEKSVAAMGNAWIYYSSEQKMKRCYGKTHDVFFSLPDNALRQEIFLNYPKPLLLQSTIFKRSALLTIGGWDKELIWDDYPMFVALFSQFSVEEKEVMYCSDMTVVKYRQHGNNAYKNIIKQLNMIEQALCKIAPKDIFKNAIARQLAFYFLLALQSRDVEVVKHIFRKVFKYRVLILFTGNVFVEMASWLKRKMSNA